MGAVTGVLPFYLFTLLPFLAACGNNGKEYDATGTFEATETTVFAEQNGALLTFNVEEGNLVEAQEEAGLIDTTQIWLKIQQLGATKEVYQSQKPDMERQIAATRQQLARPCRTNSAIGNWWPTGLPPRRCSTMPRAR